MGADGKVETLVDNYKGGRFNRPNDVICHSNGCLYFTDPDKRRPYHEREIPGPAGEDNLWDGAGVYRLAPDGSLSVLALCEYPNGLALSPDERTMYVANTRSSKYIHAIKLDAAGNMVGRSIFADLNEGTEPGIPDGLKVDSIGRVYCTGPGGIWVHGARRQAHRHHPVAGAGGEFRLRRAGSAHAAVLRPHLRLHAARQGAGQSASLVQVARAVTSEEAMADAAADLFEIIHTTRSMRRLKPDAVPDALIRQILEAGVCARAAATCNAGAFSWSGTRQSSRRSEPTTNVPGMRSSLLATGPENPHPAWTGSGSCDCSPRRSTWPPISRRRQRGSFPACRATPSRPPGPRSTRPCENMLLAARALGLGATLTTLYLSFEKEAEAALGVPADLAQLRRFFRSAIRQEGSVRSAACR